MMTATLLLIAATSPEAVLNAVNNGAKTVGEVHRAVKVAGKLDRFKTDAAIATLVKEGKLERESRIWWGIWKTGLKAK
jgi:hypothetical protein